VPNHAKYRHIMHSINCANCGKPLAFYYSVINIVYLNFIPYCYLCMHSQTDLIDELQLKQIDGTQKLYQLDKTDQDKQASLRWFRLKCKPLIKSLLQNQI